METVRSLLRSRKTASSTGGNTEARGGPKWSQLVPAVCDVSVTDLCNASCDFCGFSRTKMLRRPRRFLDRSAFARALPILRRRNIRYLTFQGGEPLLHPDIVDLVSDTSAVGMQAAIITNGWFLARYVRQLASAGLQRLAISLDSASLAVHEQNRGLSGLEGRIREGILKAHELGLPVAASVTVSRLVQYERLPETLRDLGFDMVYFSYPRRDPLPSSSEVYSSNSSLVDLAPDEILQALGAITRMKDQFPVFNSRASLAEVARYVRGERQYVPCVGGHKYFYIDWNLDIWRCEVWDKPLGSVLDLDRLPDQRDTCNACMMACYRDASMLMYAATAATDALDGLAAGHFDSAAASLFRRGFVLSLWALIEEAPQISQHGRRPRPHALSNTHH